MFSTQASIFSIITRPRLTGLARRNSMVLSSSSLARMPRAQNGGVDAAEEHHHEVGLDAVVADGIGHAQLFHAEHPDGFGKQLHRFVQRFLVCRHGGVEDGDERRFKRARVRAQTRRPRKLLRSSRLRMFIGFPPSRNNA